MANKGFKEKAYEYLKEKMGNPVMPSKEKDAIRELEEEERRLRDMREKQESGEDYPAEYHRKRT